MVTFEKHIHAGSAGDLVIKLPDEFLNKDIVLKVEEELMKPQTDQEREQKLDEFFAWVKTLNIDTRGYKFDREEANER